MIRLVRHLTFFSIAHLFFFVFIYFAMGIFSDVPDDASFFSIENTISFSIVATLTQSLLFTLLSYYFEITGVNFFLAAILIELVIANLLFLYAAGHLTASTDFPGLVLMNLCLVASLFISMIIQEYNAQSLS